MIISSTSKTFDMSDRPSLAQTEISTFTLKFETERSPKKIERTIKPINDE